MAFLPPNQQRQSTEGNTHLTQYWLMSTTRITRGWWINYSLSATCKTSQTWFNIADCNDVWTTDEHYVQGVMWNARLQITTGREHRPCWLGCHIQHTAEYVPPWTRCTCMKRDIRHQIWHYVHYHSAPDLGGEETVQIWPFWGSRHNVLQRIHTKFCVEQKSSNNDFAFGLQKNRK